MRLFRRSSEPPEPATEAPPPPTPEPVALPEPVVQVEVSRTLVKSEPELSELVESEPRLQGKGIAISMSEKGFGTRVAIAAGPDAGLSESDLESLLDRLAEPQKRPFSNS